jgi:uncharacterized protein
MPLFYPRLMSWMILIFMGFQAFPQEKLLTDIQLIRDVRTGTAGESGSPRSYVYDQNTSPVQKYNPLNAAFGGLLFVYQNVLSPQFSAHCLYAPSCSEFSKRSIQKYGLLKGLLLSADRVMRCNRMAATGIHPLRIQNNKASDPVDFYQMNP